MMKSMNLVFLALAQLAAVSNAKIIDVFDWVIPYSGPKTFDANVGDTIVFRWQDESHNVYIHPSGTCELDGAIFVGQQPDSEYIFTEADGSPEGNEMFFACDIGNGSHCFAGQSITVTVFSAATDGVPEVPAVPVVPITSVVEDDSSANSRAIAMAIGAVGACLALILF